ncbi:MAG: hypothetical protein EOP51_11465 [Sphingobacteriales bacterium]|nr:MAG: hypothetical protein EOP51_11465 [Sphingobacteriales bacterium]
MKAYTIMILMAVAVAVSTLLYINKTKQADDIDRFSNSLLPVTKYLSGGAHISIRTEPSKAELLPWARYTLAPRYLSPLPNHDTTLVIQYTQNSDSALTAFASSQRQLWQVRDSQYTYTLTTTR